MRITASSRLVVSSAHSIGRHVLKQDDTFVAALLARTETRHGLALATVLTSEHSGSQCHNEKENVRGVVH